MTQRYVNFARWMRMVLAMLVFAYPPLAFAHRGDYLNDTFVYRTVGRGVGELEYWFDLVQPADQSNFFRHSFAVEYGVTDRFMIDGLGALDNHASGYGFGRTRIEGRYRFGEEKPHGISPAVSLEYEDDRSENRRTVTPRLVLNRDFKEFNATLNLIREIELSGTQGGGFGYAAGFRYGDEERRFRIGTEIQHRFLRETTGLVIPQAWIKVTEHVTLKVGYGQRITHAGQSFFRAVLEIEFGGKIKKNDQ